MARNSAGANQEPEEKITAPEIEESAPKEETPAAKKTADKKIASTEGYHTIEEMKALRNTAAPMYEGVCRYRGWRPGKMVTAEEYDGAVKEFGGAPMGRRKQDGTA